MPEPVLETRGLNIRFGGHVAVDGVSAAFHGGKVAARHHQRVDARPVDPAERGLDHAGVHLADGVGVGCAQAF